MTSPLWPRETFELLEDRAMPTVRGNHDRWLAELPRQDMTASIAFTHGALTPHQRALLGRLPSSLELDGEIVLDYDWSQVAERAIANGRADWAAAFAS